MLKTISLALVVSAEIQARLQLYQTFNHTAEILLGGQSETSSDEGLGSRHFAWVPLGELKEKTERPGNPGELPLAYTSTVTTLGGLISRCRDWVCFIAYCLGQLNLS